MCEDNYRNCCEQAQIGVDRWKGMSHFIDHVHFLLFIHFKASVCDN